MLYCTDRLPLSTLYSCVMAPVGAGPRRHGGTGRTGDLVEKERGREGPRETEREGMRGK